jgi:hypothetical protein
MGDSALTKSTNIAVVQVPHVPSVQPSTSDVIAIHAGALHSFIQSALPAGTRCSTEFRDLGALALQRFYDVLIAQVRSIAIILCEV